MEVQNLIPFDDGTEYMLKRYIARYTSNYVTENIIVKLHSFTYKEDNTYCLILELDTLLFEHCTEVCKPLHTTSNCRNAIVHVLESDSFQEELCDFVTFNINKYDLD